MKQIILCMLLVLSFPAFSQRGGDKEASGWAFMIGQGSLNDGKKKSENLEPTGTTFKGAWTHRTKYFDAGFMARYGKLTEDVTYNSIDGKFSHSNLSLGVFGSFWLFSFLNAHAGYAFHSISEKITGNYNSTEQSELSEMYGLIDSTTYGLYGGADLVLYQRKNFQFFLNYDYYHLNGLGAGQWEAMAGMKLYLAPSKVGKGNFFVKFFQGLFSLNEK